MASGARYDAAEPFRPSADTPHPFPGLRPRQPGVATAVLEHTLTSTDRLDLLALHYYNDARKWWRILDANPEFLCGVELADPTLVGSVILIPPSEEPGGRT